MYVIEVEDKYYVAKVIIGTDDSREAFVGISEDIDDAILFDGIEGLFVMEFLKRCDGYVKFRYVEVEVDG